MGHLLGNHAFMITAPKLWNMLLAHASNTCAIDTFKTLIKTLLLNEAFQYIFLEILVFIERSILKLCHFILHV